MYPQWSNSELATLRNNLNAIPYCRIASMLPGRTVDAIKRRAGILGLVKTGKRFSKRTLIEDFFSRMDYLSCYWAGFIAADGCIITSPRTEVRIGIHERDLDHLSQFVKDTGFNGRIRIDKKDIAHVIVCAAYQWVADLDRIFRITPQKTFSLQPPKLTGPLALAYSIGYIDGDGCWATADKNRNPRLIVVGTKALLQWLVSLWNSHGANIGSPTLSFKRNVWRLTLTCAKAERIAFLLRDVDVPRLERKWRVARREATGQEVQRKS